MIVSCVTIRTAGKEKRGTEKDLHGKCTKRCSQPIFFDAILCEGRCEGVISYLFVARNGLGVFFEFGVEIGGVFVT